jgi:hypothetical protein
VTVAEVATLVRSKNAGIGLITVDVVCADPATYEAVKAALTRERVASAYRVDPEAVVDIVHFDAGLATKVALRRPRLAGGDGLGETDLYGSAQYAPIAEIELDEQARDR